MLYEGGTPGFVNIRSRVPPILFCPFDARDGCEVSLHAGVRAAKETTCPDQRTLTQAVIAWSGAEKETPFCGVSMDVSRWSQVHSIAVKAVIDALKDNDQERTVEVWASVTSEQLKQELVFNLGQVRVSKIDRWMDRWMHGWAGERREGRQTERDMLQFVWREVCHWLSVIVGLCS